EAKIIRATIFFKKTPPTGTRPTSRSSLHRPLQRPPRRSLSFTRNSITYISTFIHRDSTTYSPLSFIRILSRTSSLSFYPGLYHTFALSFTRNSIARFYQLYLHFRFTPDFIIHLHFHSLGILSPDSITYIFTFVLPRTLSYICTFIHPDLHSLGIPSHTSPLSFTPDYTTTHSFDSHGLSRLCLLQFLLFILCLCRLLRFLHLCLRCVNSL